MYSHLTDPIGAVWLMQFAQISPFLSLPVVSGIAKRRQTIKTAETGFRQEFYPESARPAETVVAHLQFHLRQEIPHLEFLQRLFHKIGGEPIQEWVNREPTGQYARRSAFLYEWLTGDQLTVPDNIAGNYVDVLDSQTLVTASTNQIEKVARWRVNNNLAGSRHFCPTLLKSEAFNQACQLDVAHLLAQLTEEFGEDLLMRSAVWLTLRESKASFAIEGEGKEINRIERFADVIVRLTGKSDLPLKPESLAQLQQEILGDSPIFRQFGLRQSPVFVGQTAHFKEVVHYIAPPFESLTNKLDGLWQFWQKTIGQSPVMRSAVLAFGFVYIHPLADGNGRVHRFLLNDLLRRDQVLPEAIILPISGVIADSSEERYQYAKLLDSISQPLMQGIKGQYRFSTSHTTYADGIRSNLVFEQTENAEPVWRYPNLTPHVQYVARLIEKVISVDMHQESQYLRHHEQARATIKNIVEMPNDYADRLIRSIQENQGKRSNKLLKEFNWLGDDELWEKLAQAVMTIFKR